MLSVCLPPVNETEKPSRMGTDAPASKLGQARKIFILVFASVHAVKLLSGIMPEQKRPCLPSYEVAQAYEALTGSRQDWKMFESIPVYHKWRARLVIRGVNGKERETGVILPAFQTWPDPAPARLYCHYERLFSGAHSAMLKESSLRRLDEELKRRGLSPGETWRFESIEDFTRHLVHVRRDGRLYERRIHNHELPASNQVRP